MYDIPTAFRDQFSDSFRDVVQQKDSRLMKTVNVQRGLTGISKEINFIGTLEDEEITGQRFKKVTVSEIELNGRWYYPREFQGKHFESSFDEKKLAPRILGSGQIITAMQRAYLRRCDNIIINALVGNAYVGENGNTVATALPAGQTVPVDYQGLAADADGGFNASKLIEGIRILSTNEAWNEDVAAMGESLWCVIDAKEEARMRLQANSPTGDRLYSNEFGGPPVYDAKGFLSRWGAVNFVIYNNLPTDTVVGQAGTDTIAAKIVPLYVSSALEFGVWQDNLATVDRRPDLSNAIQFLAQCSIGAGREQEEKVVRIDCTVA
jgi:hypothetical protein